MKKVALFTANTQGGIIQFTLQIYETLKKNGIDTKVFLPSDVKGSDLSVIADDDLCKYDKVKAVFDKRPYRVTANEIMHLSPDAVFYMDNSPVSQNVGLYLKKDIKQFMTLHDAGTYHPTNKLHIRERLVRAYTAAVNKRFCKKVTSFVLLSKESLKTFIGAHPGYADRTILMPLGAHLPHDAKCALSEAENIQNGFFLFFGRIDKYKGIGNLLEAYKDIADKALPLVIAGNGEFTDKEKQLIAECKNLTVIKRYITDGEMKWLLSRSTAVVLPYIEATQSGVIPLSYIYEKPVIVSNVPGLTQFVVDGRTGFICSTKEQWQQRLLSVDKAAAEKMSADIKEYYNNTLDWDKNISEFIKHI